MLYIFLWSALYFKRSVQTKIQEQKQILKSGKASIVAIAAISDYMKSEFHDFVFIY